LKYLQLQEDKLRTAEREGELERNVFAANPGLWKEMFSHEEPGMDENGMMWAETPEELEEIAQEMERQGWVPGT
jgi:hypothetical protein